VTSAQGLRANAGEHVVHPVGDRLPDADRSWQHRKARAYLRKNLVAGLSRRLQIDVDLAEMNAFGVLVAARPVRRPTEVTSGTSISRRKRT
jgi:hypothetical protein